ncbi:MAG TPA: hypothetical protein VHE14_09240 [Solirubrobacteraceae bacterium]|nr:hypothetical protein [Solirubrobacteraceae bacterium]
MATTTLLAVPNVSEGRDRETIAAIGSAFAAGARLLDLHSDADHNRSVYTLAGKPQALAHAVVAGAREALERVDLAAHDGVHPCVGTIDVAPIVFLDDARIGAACAEALLLGDLLGGELGLPVFLYGGLGGGRTRADLRRGGLAGLAERMADGELVPDFGPAEPHRTGGVVLVSARPPLVAFNLLLAEGATLAQARAVAARIREGGEEGLPGLRAIGLELERQGAVQLSINVEDPLSLPLAAIVEAVRRHATVATAELVGLAPRAALDGFPADVALPGFDPARHLIENALEDDHLD